MDPAIEGVFEYIESIRNDNNELKNLRSKNSEFFDLLLDLKSILIEKPFEIEEIPYPKDIKAIEATLFDNHTAVAYNLELKIWNESNSSIVRYPDWVGTARLWNKQQAKNEISITLKRSNSPNIDEGIREPINGIFDNGATHVGILCLRSKIVHGTYYYCDHFVAIRLDQDCMIKKLYILARGFCIQLTGFVNTSVKGFAFQKTGRGSDIKCQSRTSYDPTLTKWASIIETKKEVEDE